MNPNQRTKEYYTDPLTGKPKLWFPPWFRTKETQHVPDEMYKSLVAEFPEYYPSRNFSKAENRLALQRYPIPPPPSSTTTREKRQLISAPSSNMPPSGSETRRVGDATTRVFTFMPDVSSSQIPEYYKIRYVNELPDGSATTRAGEARVSNKGGKSKSRSKSRSKKQVSRRKHFGTRKIGTG
jgi:hypothetical protein